MSNKNMKRKKNKKNKTSQKRKNQKDIKYKRKRKQIESFMNRELKRKQRNLIKILQKKDLKMFKRKIKFIKVLIIKKLEKGQIGMINPYKMAIHLHPLVKTGKLIKEDIMLIILVIIL